MATSTWTADKIAALLGEHPDFPKKGILFYDILPIFRHPDAVRAIIDHMAAFVRSQGIAMDVIIGLEARGFLFGPLLAQALGVPFAPIRKQGKLPGAVLQSAYRKEYGSDTFEIQQAAITAGQHVLVVDDLLATGGTAMSAIDLIQRLGGVAVGFCCVVELPALNGRARLPAGLPIFSLIQRDG